jgi:hypothetical protein
VATEVINRALERLKSETALGEEIMKGEDVRQLIRKYGEF